MNNFKNFFHIIPIIFYYLLESAFLALIVNIIWRLMFQSRCNIILSYGDFVAIIWVIKMLLFDVFKISNTFGNNQEINKENNN